MKEKMNRLLNEIKNAIKTAVKLLLIILCCIALIKILVIDDGYQGLKERITGIFSSEESDASNELSNDDANNESNPSINIEVSKTKELAKAKYDGSVIVEVNGNEPEFSDKELKQAEKSLSSGGFESYSRLDRLGRCGSALACVCVDTMPEEGAQRTSLGSVSPSGWQSINFWSRCHLIAYMLSAENANERNLITGTVYFNTSGMLTYERQVGEYIDNNPNCHVLYKVEPVYKGKNLVASGVRMQALSMEDDGEGICFDIYVFNLQPGYIINYKDGTVEDDPEHQTYVTLEDKIAKYSGSPIYIGDAKVDGSHGDVRYIYYTDEAGKIKTTYRDGSSYDGAAPSEKGVYYARAVVTGDAWYPSGVSNVAKLVIE